MNKFVKQPVTMLTMQRTCAGACEHTVTSRRIGNGWNVRVFLNGVLNQEVRVYAQNLIGAAARDLLRWEDKCGNISDYASKARHRAKTIA
jgi:hypothetical protein